MTTSALKCSVDVGNDRRRVVGRGQVKWRPGQTEGGQRRGKGGRAEARRGKERRRRDGGQRAGRQEEERKGRRVENAVELS